MTEVFTENGEVVCVGSSFGVEPRRAVVRVHRKDADGVVVMPCRVSYRPQVAPIGRCSEGEFARAASLSYRVLKPGRMMNKTSGDTDDVNIDFGLE